MATPNMPQQQRVEAGKRLPVELLILIVAIALSMLVMISYVIGVL